MRTRVLIIHYTPPGVIGGVEHVIQHHVEALSRIGFDVTVVAGRAADDSVRVIPQIDVARPESQRIEGELDARVVSERFFRHRRAILDELQALARQSDFIIAHNALTLHFSLPLTSVLWELAAGRPPGTLIAWCHDLSWSNPLYRPTMHDGYPWNLLRTPAPGVQYVTVSEERKRELRDLWGNVPEEIDVVPNGIDAAKFLRLAPALQEIVDRYRLFERDVVLLLPVRVTRRKNIELGLHVVRRLKDRGQDVCFVISGPQAPHHPGRSDAYLAELRELCLDLHIQDDVVFLASERGETLDRDLIPELFSIADALFFPSRQEGFGLPILEAGLARLPAIVSDVPIFREVGRDDVARFDLSAPADTIAEEIARTLDQRPSRLYRRVLRDYRWDVIVDRCILPLLRRPDVSASS
jgi:glycosyltransferase involved in cell wall biosynthesis